MTKKVNLYIFNLSEDSLPYRILNDHFATDDRVSFSIIRLYKDITETILTSSQGIVFFKVENKSDFIQSLSILKRNHELIKKGYVRPVCLLKVQSSKVERLLFKYGCSDLLDFNINSKTLLTKANLWLKSLSSVIKDDEEYLKLSKRSQDLPAQAIVVGGADKKADKNDFEIDSEFDDLLDELDQDIDLLETQELALEDEELSSIIEEVDSENIKNEFKSDSEEKSEDLKFVTTEESSPDLVEYIKENGEVGQLNLETGFLGLSLTADTSGEVFNCVFENFEEDHMTLEVSERYDAKEGDKLEVAVKFIYNKCRVEIGLAGILSEIELLSDGRKQVTISFSQNETQIYDYFMSLYEKRQKSINDFMELARGH